MSGGMEINPSGEGASLDPRIQDELERLNTASAEINNLEKQLDESRQHFRQTLTESTQQLEAKLKKCRKSAAKAQSYYTAREEARRAQESAQEAALSYQRASSMFLAAKETISIAEEAAITNKNKTEKKRQFDSALQEMLNLSTMKLNAAEREKMESQREHERRSQHYIATQQQVDLLAKKFKRSIANSASYYELKKTFFHELNDLKVRTEGLQRALHDSKEKYHRALKNLEQISEDIHHSRQVAAILAERRQSGVGADSNTDSELGPDTLNIPFKIDETLDSVSISTDTESMASEPFTPKSTPKSTPRDKERNLASRSISGSSMPLPADETDVGRRITAGRGSVEGASGTFSRSGHATKDQKYEEDEEDDDDDDDDDDIVFGVESDGDTDDSDGDDCKGSNQVRKLRTISLGDLSSSFGMFDKGDIDIDGKDEKRASVEKSVITETTPSFDEKEKDSVAANDQNEAEFNSREDDENNERENDDNVDGDDQDAKEKAIGNDIAVSSSNSESANPEVIKTANKTDDDAIWI